MWGAADLGAFNFRVTFMDQRLITTTLGEQADGICTGLALLWVARILASPGENAWARLHWAKKQQLREKITADYDKQYGKERKGRRDELMKKHDPEGKLTSIPAQIAQLKHESRRANLETQTKKRQEIDKLEETREEIEESASKDLHHLMEELDQHATIHQLGPLLKENRFQVTADTLRCETGSKSQVDAFVKRLEDRIPRPAGLLLSITFFQGMSQVRHMWAGYWKTDAFRVFDPNTGEYYCPSANAALLIASLQAQYELRTANITDIQALKVEAV
jgi:hypothetical protein